uniref:MLLT6, PHD finger containing n=1 Tax=Vombatus ursinus TaxID=29139 RepID=A0A4X2K9S4_VOMUR
MKEMVGGCCVCSDERGWAENPLVYCDGHACSVAVHQACYGIVQVPTGPWFCRKCESQERAARVRCELCPHKDGALKRTDNGGWAHVVCALYIPEVQFANVLTMEPIVLQYVPHDRFNKTCYICEEQGRESKAASGACMTCNRHGCRQAFHVTCAQMAGLLCEEEVLEVDNVKYCGYCKYHFSKMVSRDGSLPSLPIPFSSNPAPPEGPWLYTFSDGETSLGMCLILSRIALFPPQGSSSSSSSSHHEGSAREPPEGSRDAKGKKSSSHSLSHKGKKLSSGKGVASFTSASSSSSSSSTGGPFQPTVSSLQSSPDFSSFPKLEQPEEEKYPKTTPPGPPPPVSPPSSEPPKADVFEQKVVFSGFGSIMRFSTSASGTARARVPSPGAYKAPHIPGGGTGPGSHKRMPSLSAASEEVVEGLKEKKHKGSKKNRHGPGRPKGSRNKEGVGGPLAPSLPGAQLAGFTATAASPFSGGSLVSSGVNNASASRAFGHQAALPSLSLESPLLGAGIYTSNKDPISHGGGVLRAVCSTPLSSSLLGPTGTSSLPQLSRSPFASTLPASSASISTTQVFSLAGSTFSLPSSHIFGTPMGSVNPLLTQAENSRTEPSLEDCSFGCRGTSPQESLSSMSPISSLPTLFDQTAPSAPCTSSQLDPAAQGTANMEQLLEKQGNGEAGVNIVEMLKALHSLQKENQRLQEQIMSLTAKKERLQILNVQLSVPFPVVPAGVPTANGWQWLSPDNSFGLENSLSMSSEDPHSGCPSRSSSSLSFHSTPPPLPLLQQSPATLPLALPGPPAPQQPQSQNGLGRGAGGVGLGTVSMADGLLGAQKPAQPHLPCPSALQDHQTVVYQMIQQIQQKRELQRLQMSGGSQLPMASLLAGGTAPLLPSGTPGLLPSAAAPPLLPAGSLVAPALGTGTTLMAAAAGGPPVLTAQTNPFLSLPGADNSGQKGGSGDKGSSCNQEKG